MEIAQLLLSGLRSLWGVVTPNIRKVFVEEKDRVISIHFYYDQAPSEIEIELSEEAATEVISHFAGDYCISCERQVVKSPTQIQSTGLLIYSRYEL